ncbi:MAG: rod shape-determining protein MreC [Candidatus Kerfeldbacteria bacterium]|nr:rod shape-determining protein MreC [Candidatus Kerfeldbacteria bacterium]
MARPTLRPARTVLVIIGLAIVGFFALHRIGALRPLEGFGVRVFAPLQSGLARAAQSVQAFGQSIAGTRSIHEENEQLRDTLAAALAENERLRLDREEAVEVDRALQFLGERSWTGTVARVVGRSPDPTFQLFLVNRGRSQGVLPGAAVIVGDGVLVGKVLESEPESARFIVLTDSHARVAGRVENERHSQGILTGEHGLSLRMDLLEKTDPVEPGTLVVTSGIEQGIPAGLVIGRITAVEQRPGDLFQSASVDAVATVRSLTVVTILTFDHA